MHWNDFTPSQLRHAQLWAKTQIKSMCSVFSQINYLFIGKCWSHVTRNTLILSIIISLHYNEFWFKSQYFKNTSSMIQCASVNSNRTILHHDNCFWLSIRLHYIPLQIYERWQIAIVWIVRMCITKWDSDIRLSTTACVHGFHLIREQAILLKFNPKSQNLHLPFVLKTNLFIYCKKK